AAFTELVAYREPSAVSSPTHIEALDQAELDPARHSRGVLLFELEVLLDLVLGPGLGEPAQIRHQPVVAHAPPALHELLHLLAGAQDAGYPYAAARVLG